MLGAIIGDIAGSRFEFEGIPEREFNFFCDPPLSNYTDDTVMTIAIADAILHNRPWAEAMRDWGNRYPNPKGAYGNEFVKWLFDPERPANPSCGNGAAMRVAAIGWLFDDYDSVRKAAREQALVSHNHPEAVRGAECVATLIFQLRTCHISREDTERYVKQKFGYTLPPLADINKIGRQGHFDGICQETVPWAIRCFVESNSFEEAIRLAVLARGDTDTKAAICGSIAEAFYNVPSHFTSKALEYLEDDMLDVVMEALARIRQQVDDD